MICEYDITRSRGERDSLQQSFSIAKCSSLMNWLEYQQQ